MAYILAYIVNALAKEPYRVRKISWEGKSLLVPTPSTPLPHTRAGTNRCGGLLGGVNKPLSTVISHSPHYLSIKCLRRKLSSPGHRVYCLSILYERLIVLASC